MYQQPPSHSNNASPHRGLHNGYSNFPVPQTGSPHATNFAPQPYSLQHKSPYSPSTQSHHDLHNRPCMPHQAGVPHPNISMSNPTPMQASTHSGFTQPQHLMPNSAYHQPNPVSTAPPSFALKNNNNNNHSLPQTSPMFYNNPTSSGYPMQNNPYQRMPQYPNQASVSQPPTWDNTTHNIHHHQRTANHLQSPKSDMSNSPTSNSSNDGKSSRANRSFTCPKCAKVFKRGDHLKRHLLSVHDREHPYQCGECSKGFASISTLLRHGQTSHSGITTKGHLCVRCNIRIVNLQEFENHATSLHEAQDLEYMKNINQCSRTYSCSLCNKTVSSEKNLKRHVKKLHGDVMEENSTSAISNTSTAVASPSVSTQSQPTVNTTIANALNPTAQPEPVQAHHQSEPNFQMEFPKAVPETFPFNVVPQITTASQNIEHAVKPIKSESVLTAPAPHAVKEEKLTVESYTANQKEIENKMPKNIVQNSVTDTTQAMHSQQYFTSCASNTLQSAAPIVYSEPNTVSEAFSMAMKALSDFSYDDLSFSSTDYLSAGPSVFQSNSPLPNFHYPSRARMQTDQVDSRDYYQASSVQQETGAEYPGQALSYPEVKVFSAPVCHDITVTPPLQQDSLNGDKSYENGSFQVKRGRPKKKRRRDEEEEDDDQGLGMITKDPASENLSYNCTVCSEVYEGIDKLMQHVEAVHLSLNPHECCICNKRFAQAGNVKRHIRFVHLRERPFRCRECDSTFDRLCYLQRHMRAHIDSKADSPVASQLNPCNCPECGKRCLTTHHLRGHMQRKHFAKNKNRSEDLRSKYGYLFNDLDQVNQGEKMGSKPYDQNESKKMLNKQNNEVHVVSNATIQQTPQQQIIDFSTVPLQPNLHNSEVQGHELHEDNSQLSMLLTANDDESHDISSKLNIKSNPLTSEVIGQGRSIQFKLDPPKKMTAVKINTKRKNRIKIYYGNAMIKKIKSRIQLRYKCHCCVHPGFPKIYLLKSHLAVAHHSATKCHICIGCGRSFSTSDSLLVHIRKQHKSKKIDSSVCSSRKQLQSNSKPHSVDQKGFSKIEALHMTNNMSVLGHFAYKEPQARFENIPQLSTHSLVHAEM